VPILIYSRQDPGIDISQWPLVTYRSDLETAMFQAREGPSARRRIGPPRCHRAAGMLDELELMSSVPFGQGRRLFDNLDRAPAQC
jgi:hypothetical protein